MHTVRLEMVGPVHVSIIPLVTPSNTTHGDVFKPVLENVGCNPAVL